jgi:hypothetical protein
MIVHGDHCRRRAMSDEPGEQVTIRAIAQQKRLDRANIGVGDGLHPIAEIRRAKTRRRHALTVKPGRISIGYGLAFIYYHDHKTTPESL